MAEKLLRGGSDRRKPGCIMLPAGRKALNVSDNLGKLCRILSGQTVLIVLINPDAGTLWSVSRNTKLQQAGHREVSPATQFRGPVQIRGPVHEVRRECRENRECREKGGKFSDSAVPERN